MLGFYGHLCQIGDRPNEALIIDDFSVPLPLLLDQREYLLVVQLLQTKQLVEILDFITYAQLVITILDVSQHQVHQLPENLLIA